MCGLLNHNCTALPQAQAVSGCVTYKLLLCWCIDSNHVCSKASSLCSKGDRQSGVFSSFSLDARHTCPVMLVQVSLSVQISQVQTHTLQAASNIAVYLKDHALHSCQVFHDVSHLKDSTAKQAQVFSLPSTNIPCAASPIPTCVCVCVGASCHAQDLEKLS